MWTAFGRMFGTSSFMPHGHCFLWNPALLRLNVISDGLIALAYYSIPLLLFLFVRRRRDLPYKWLFVMFGAFIVVCGTSHVMEIVTIWRPEYWLEAIIKAVAAAISIATAIALIPIVPRALALRSPAELDRLNRELGRSNAELERFAHVASHDLREPLRTIGSFSQLLGRRYKGRLEPEAAEFLDHTLAGVKRMEQLLDDLLAYSRVGSARPGARPVACESVLQDTLQALGTAIKDSGAQITHGPLPTISGDRVQMGQLFQNLLANAIKFRRGPAPSIDVSALRQGPFWQFTVRDDGIGIHPEYGVQIFAMFERLHERDVYSGTGIGLAICKRIVERHGGTIWLDHESGAGAVFHFTMPAGPA